MKKYSKMERENKTPFWKRDFGGKKMRKTLIYAGVAGILYFPKACSIPRRASEMHEERNYFHQPLRIEDYIPKDEELREAA